MVLSIFVLSFLFSEMILTSIRLFPKKLQSRELTPCPITVSLKCYLVNLNKNTKMPLKDGGSYGIGDGYDGVNGRYDITCEMTGADFVKFDYGGSIQDAWKVPYYMSGVPFDDPGCNRPVKYLSGACGTPCTGPKTVIAYARQTNDSTCRKETYTFTCPPKPTPAPVRPTHAPVAPTPAPVPKTAAPTRGNCPFPSGGNLSTCPTDPGKPIKYRIFEKKEADKGKCKPKCEEMKKVKELALKEPNKWVCECGGGLSEDVCDTCGKPTSLRFLWVDEAATNTTQPVGKYSIKGATNLDGPFAGVTVSVTNTAIDVIPDAVGFTLKAARFDSNTFIDLKRDSATMQIQYHTSCSAPITQYDVIANIQLVGYRGSDGVCGFGAV
jgi:hypothetical protein